MRQLAKLLSWKFRLRGFESRPHRQLALAALGLASCAVDRRLHIESDPPGAEIVVDAKPTGPAPLDLHFTHYGVRLVRAELAGHEPREVAVELEPPWYGKFPFDLVTEILFPVWRTDFHEVRIALEPTRPAKQASPEEVQRRDREAIESAQALRRWVPGEPLPASAPASRPRPPS
jgi:PEGA domain-containing protein